jgi:hypothetical protein
MKQVELQVSRTSGESIPQSRDTPHDFREFVQRHRNEIDLSGDGAVEWVIGITKSRSKSKRPVICKIIGAKTKRLSL